MQVRKDVFRSEVVSDEERRRMDEELSAAIARVTAAAKNLGANLRLAYPENHTAWREPDCEPGM